MERRWISAAEAADYLSLHVKTIYSLIAKGAIAAAKVGGSVRIDLKKLEASMERGCTNTKPQSHG